MKFVVFRFVTVGAIGFTIQIAALAALTSLAQWSWLTATLVAVELAVVHNFLWHERWTWADRRLGGWSSVARFARFSASTGLISLAGNVVLMWILADRMGLPPVLANAMAVGVMSVANFMAADRLVFYPPPLKRQA